MPWNDNANPGPWGSPPPGEGEKGLRGPGGPRRPDGPQVPPQLNEILRRLRDMFGGPGGGLRPGAFVVVAAVAFGFWAFSGLYQVGPNEQALVTTFGSFSRKEGPGLRYHLPSPIENVEKVAITTLNKTDVGGSAGADTPEEALMLTGDENIVDVNFSVTWRVSDAPNYVFTMRDPDDAVKAVAESAIREVVGKTDLQSIITNGRGQLQRQTADLMQKTLDRWGAGVTIVEVQVRSANPPPEVVPAAREVLNAGQEAQSKVNEADTYRNRVVNEAKGDASRITQSAEAYREQAVREALGEASRFNQIYGEYRRAPEVTRQRLYIETMQRVLAKSNKVVVDGKGTTAPIILPPDVFRPKAKAPVETAGPGEGQTAASPDAASAGAPK